MLNENINMQTKTHYIVLYIYYNKRSTMYHTVTSQLDKAQ